MGTHSRNKTITEESLEKKWRLIFKHKLVIRESNAPWLRDNLDYTSLFGYRVPWQKSWVSLVHPTPRGFIPRHNFVYIHGHEATAPWLQSILEMGGKLFLNAGKNNLTGSTASFRCHLVLKFTSLRWRSLLQPHRSCLRLTKYRLDWVQTGWTAANFGRKRGETYFPDESFWLALISRIHPRGMISYPPVLNPYRTHLLPLPRFRSCCHFVLDFVPFLLRYMFLFSFWLYFC